MTDESEFPALGRLFLEIGKTIDNSSDLVQAPQTAIKRMERDIARSFEMADPEALGAEFLSLLQLVPEDVQALRDSFSAILRHTKKLAMEDTRYSMLMKIAAEASAISPNLALFAWMKYPREDHILRITRALPRLESAKSLAGELRANETLTALKDVVELVYKPFLRELVRLDMICNHDFRRPSEGLADLVSQAIQRFKNYPGLIDEDAAWLRNSDAHVHSSYDDSMDVLTLWDKNKPRSSIAVGELLDRVNAMWTIGGPTFLAVRDLLALRLQEKVDWSGSSIAILRASFDGDLQTAESLDREFQQRTDKEVSGAIAYIKRYESMLPPVP